MNFLELIKDALYQYEQQQKETLKKYLTSWLSEPADIQQLREFYRKNKSTKTLSKESVFELVLLLMRSDQSLKTIKQLNSLFCIDLLLSFVPVKIKSLEEKAKWITNYLTLVPQKREHILFIRYSSSTEWSDRRKLIEECATHNILTPDILKNCLMLFPPYTLVQILDIMREAKLLTRDNLITLLENENVSWSETINFYRSDGWNNIEFYSPCWLSIFADHLSALSESNILNQVHLEASLKHIKYLFEYQKLFESTLAIGDEKFFSKLLIKLNEKNILSKHEKLIFENQKFTTRLRFLNDKLWTDEVFELLAKEPANVTNLIQCFNTLQKLSIFTEETQKQFLNFSSNTLNSIARGVNWLSRYQDTTLTTYAIKNLVLKHPMLFPLMTNDYFGQYWYTSLFFHDTFAPAYFREYMMDINLINGIIAECEQVQNGDYTHVYQAITQRVNQLLGRETVNNQQNNINPTQSTHTASVHKTVSESILRLRARYKDKNLDQSLIEMDKWLNSLEDKNIQIKAAKNSFIRLQEKNHHFVDPVSNTSILQILSLFWTAIHDDTTRVGSLENAKKQLLQALYEVQREYNFDQNGNDFNLKVEDKPACKGGTVNKLIEKLVGISPDAQVEFVTTQTAALKLPIIVREEVRLYLEKSSLSLSTPSVLKIFSNTINLLKQEGVEAIWDKIQASVSAKMLDEFGSLWQQNKNDSKFIEMIETGKDTDISSVLNDKNIQKNISESRGYQKYCSELLRSNHGLWSNINETKISPNFDNNELKTLSYKQNTLD